ncbi:unnamed protein product [Rotaria sp. Silwood1]|nr:unnamed protein product [Rotaria sp. Silwood1]
MHDTNGQIVAGGRGQGSQLDQLNGPTDMLIDKETESFIICERGVVRWSRRCGTTQEEILLDNIDCCELAMDDQGYLYISHVKKHDVRRYWMGDKNKILVAGGNGEGAGLNQFKILTSIFFDRQQAIYVSDSYNHRVMKWNRGAKEGIIVAGGQGQGSALTQLPQLQGLIVDMCGTIYVVDSKNHRVIRWPQGVIQGTMIVGGNGEGEGANQFKRPIVLTLDRHGSIYVVDQDNHRVQRYIIL